MQDNTEEKIKELLSGLNENQRAAVEYCQGASLVVAGAGSGKTRVLTYKIAYLMMCGVLPYRILALTFTNKAAKEMQSRIGQLVSHDDAKQLYMGTFHSVFSRILRAEADKLGYERNFTIYDESDSRSLIKTIVKSLGLDDKKYKASSVHGLISMAKNHLITADAYSNDQAAKERDRAAQMPAVSQIYTTYQAHCRQSNAMDFDDLLVNTYRLFQEHEDICKKYAECFQYILVDEYQDTNIVQTAIVQLLAQQHQRICVVGDDYQSIYSFRGANIDNILDFQNRFNDVKVFKLERNYRSTQKIVEAANSLMKHNSRQIPKDVYSKESEGAKISYKPCYSDREEAMVVVKEINQLKRRQSFEYDAFAILYRTNAQSRSFEDELRKNNIPYQIFGGTAFYQRKEIKDIIAYFRMVANPNDEEAFKRIVNYPARGIGNTTIQKILDCADEHQVSLWEIVSDPLKYNLAVNKGTLAKINGFTDIITNFIKQLATTDAYTLGSEIIKESGMMAELNRGIEAEDVARRENLDEFLGSLQAFVEGNREEGREEETFLTDFLQEVSLYSDLDKATEDKPKVTLMTIHAAKGLEFPVVFIVGLEENVFPNQMSATSLRELEEERRLLYVAMTRAEQFCILTNAKNRYRYGSMQFNNPSRFIADIDPKYIAADEEMSFNSGGTGRMPWDRPASSDNFRDYEPNKPYTGSREWESGNFQKGGRWQNANPVASQFRADPKPKITERKAPERAIDPLSARTKQRLMSEGGNFKKLSAAIANGGRQYSEPTLSANVSNAAVGELKVGNIIEHQRFGIGEVMGIEGVGENTKATVTFRNAGTKQLLLKFAKYKIVKD
ncbi:ATP-dependent helicase [Prevotella disiens]|uniref:DNA 3'-5' helicase n=1 Tax=Prevotella disiens DNF00882 TaxID=1401075 RepID=A0A096AUN1_9BACT|nr:UvrD-helicase domain-containing protein [Prevotella disiens]KGF50500.1 ATP-dependent DNA helicase [Prevotella disiens DNF00882]